MQICTESTQVHVYCMLNNLLQVVKFRCNKYLFSGGGINIGVVSHQSGNNKFDMLSHFTQHLGYLFTTHAANINFTNLKNVITTS